MDITYSSKYRKFIDYGLNSKGTAQNTTYFFENGYAARASCNPFEDGLSVAVFKHTSDDRDIWDILSKTLFSDEVLENVEDLDSVLEEIKKRK